MLAKDAAYKVGHYSKTAKTGNRVNYPLMENDFAEDSGLGIPLELNGQKRVGEWDTSFEGGGPELELSDTVQV